MGKCGQNIYEGCLDNERSIYSYNYNNFKKMLKEALLEVQCNYALVDVSSGIFYGARIVTYENEVSEVMKNYKSRWEFSDEGALIGLGR